MLNYNERVDDIFVFSGIRILKTQAGKPYVTGALIRGKDRVRVVAWNTTENDVAGMEGSFVSVQGVVGEYNGEKQITADSIRCVEDKTVFDPSQIVPTAPIDVEACFAEVVKTINSMKDLALKHICESIIGWFGEDMIKTLPAAKSVHHAFIGGLLMHIYTMLMLAKALCWVYNRCPGRESAIDMDLLSAGIIFHDIGKALEFHLNKCGLVADYTPEGRQFGHSVLGARIVDSFFLEKPSNRITQLKHLLLSHHGSPEHGAAVLPMTLEAIILSQLDSLDSKTEAAMEALDEISPGNYTDRLLAFDGRQLYKPQL
ncbi:MAG: HD domain-containing protein [Oscillospiraceae bacterium]|nr:HD domain-containing protein [Oscillospiraceae bacterium]